MIEKLEIQEIEHWTGSEYTIREQVPATSEQMHDKINELVDVVNKQDKAIRLLINGLECLAKGQQLMNTEIEIKG